MDSCNIAWDYTRVDNMRKHVNSVKIYSKPQPLTSIVLSPSLFFLANRSILISLNSTKIRLQFYHRTELHSSHIKLETL